MTLLIVKKIYQQFFYLLSYLPKDDFLFCIKFEYFSHIISIRLIENFYMLNKVVENILIIF